MWPLPHRLRLQQIWLIVGRQAWGMAISGKSRVAITENANTKASYKQREDTKLWKNASSSKLADMETISNPETTMVLEMHRNG